MNILIINSGKEYGGAEIYTQQLLEGLQKKGHSVYLAINRYGKMRKRYKTSTVLLLECNFRKSIIDYIRIRKFIIDNKIEIIHCNGKNAMLLALFIRKCGKIGVLHGDILVDYHSAHVKKYVHLLLEYIVIKLYRNVVAVSEPLKKLLSKRYNKEIFFVNNAIDYIEYNEYADIYNKCLNVCSIGRLNPIKNFDILIQSFQILKKQGITNIRCDIYGEGEDRERLQAMIDLYGLKNVRLCGFKSDVRNRLNNYHVYIQPSAYESFGLATLEAYNAGCYVIANKIGGLEYIVDKMGVEIC